MSCLLSLVCFVAYWFSWRPELMIAAALFAIAAEIYYSRTHKDDKEENNEEA